MKSVDERIDDIMKRRAGGAVGPDKVDVGAEPPRNTTGGLLPDGTRGVNVTLTQSREQILAARNAPTKFGMHSSSIVMPATSTEPTADNAVLLGDTLVFNSDDGGPFTSSRERVSVILTDGRRIDDPKAALWAIYEALRAGGKPTLPTQAK